MTAFASLVADRRGIITAHVLSAQPLNDLQRQQLRARLIEAGYGNVNILEQIQPDLLGGLVVRIGARLYDTSLKSVSYTHLDVYKRQHIWKALIQKSIRRSRQMRTAYDFFSESSRLRAECPAIVDHTSQIPCTRAGSSAIRWFTHSEPLSTIPT